MAPSPPPIPRPLVGLLGLLCLVVGVALAIFAPDQNVAVGAFVRVAAVMLALWWALPRRGESWALERATPLLLVGVVLIVMTRKMILAIVPALMIVALLWFILRLPLTRRPRR